MAALLTLTETELLGLSETDLLAMTTDGESGGGSSGFCVWTEERVAALENRLSAIETVLGTLATASALEAAQNSIISQCRTASGFATPEDVKLTTTTETVEVISQTVDLSGIPASVWNYGTIADRVVTAGSVEISGDVQVDASSIAAAVWSSPERELTQDVASPADVKLTTTTQTVDLTDLKTYGDAHWKTAEGFARAETVDPALNLISALIKRWKVSGSALTAYGNSGEVLGTFTLVKDTSGNIIEVR